MTKHEAAVLEIIISQRQIRVVSRWANADCAFVSVVDLSAASLLLEQVGL